MIVSGKPIPTTQRWLRAVVLLGARGLVTPAGLWMGTALPALAVYVFGSVAGGMAESRVRRARTRWYRRAWAEDLASDEAQSWRAAFRGEGLPEGQVTTDALMGRGLRPVAYVVGALAVLLSVPILTLVPTAAVGPILTQLAVPGVDNVGARGARAEAMRSYRVLPDASVTPAEAGGSAARSILRGYGSRSTLRGARALPSNLSDMAPGRRRGEPYRDTSFRLARLLVRVSGPRSDCGTAGVSR